MIPRSPTMRDNIVHFVQGACQLSCAYLVSMPFFFVPAILVMGLSGLCSYQHNINLAKNIDLPLSLEFRNQVVKELKYGRRWVTANLVIVFVFYVASRVAGLEPSSKEIAVTLACILVTISSSVARIGSRKDEMLRTPIVQEIAAGF
jgi:hypothetical protein